MSASMFVDLKLSSYLLNVETQLDPSATDLVPISTVRRVHRALQNLLQSPRLSSQAADAQRNVSDPLKYRSTVDFGRVTEQGF
jgi:hypothetical protein